MREVHGLLMKTGSTKNATIASPMNLSRVPPWSLIVHPLLSNTHLLMQANCFGSSFSEKEKRNDIKLKNAVMYVSSPPKLGSSPDSII